MKTVVVFQGGGALGAFGAGAWQALAALWLDRIATLHNHRAMWQMLEQEFPAYTSAPGGSPLLAAAAVDVMSGELRLFDSDSSPVTARHLAASGAIPLLFDPVEIDGRLYWDGEVTRDSVLPLLLTRLLRNGRLSPAEPVQLVTVEQFPRPLPARPYSGAEISYRVLNLLQLGKLDPPALDGLHIARLRRIVREPLSDDGMSGQFDYSPRRIQRLMAEGCRRASLAALEPRPAPALSTAARGLPVPGSELANQGASAGAG